MLATLAGRDGLMHAPELGQAVDESLAYLGGVFQEWQDAGRIRDDLGDPGDLAFSLLAPSRTRESCGCTTWPYPNSAARPATGRCGTPSWSEG
ncbi:hypothetical protein DP939_44445 [Spongiactinospora rosea]|uniref:Uncharacterized protein n=1 Tax=Spongiactinospora rosea TaxID=2248750 RepID=A0A366LFA5_9ACTN|nr:hypothetical protein [Spongiactinospora rosea]RBQ12153.1 hypothetical protein DP939_44445 [Spongiactinospora rosea]